MMKRIATLIILTTGILSGCTVNQTLTRSNETCSPRILERIYFGANTPTNPVSESEWQQFLSTIVTPRFPAGLTVMTGNGQWKGENGTIEHETSRTVEIIHPDEDASLTLVDEIVREYKTRFKQEAVLLVRIPVSACL